MAPQLEWFVFFATLPLWVLMAKIYGLYEHDEERTDHSTVDEIVGIFHLVTVGAWFTFAVTWFTPWVKPDFTKLTVFWLLAIAGISLGREAARSVARRRLAYLQNAVIVGAGDVGQLIGRKLLQHPEYGINLVGFVDAEPKERRADLEHLTLLGPPERLATIVEVFDVERVLIAFSNASHEEMLELIRSLKDLDVQIDLVPRLFDVVTPSVGIHTVEGLPLIGLRPLRLSHSSRFLKRALDLIGSIAALVVLAPLFALTALAIKLESPGPVFFRQVRMGAGDRTFRIYKFRTMCSDAEEQKPTLAHLNSYARNGGDERHVQGRRRSPCDAGRALPPPLLARRVPTASERLPRRDVSRRAPAAHPRRGQVRSGLGPAPPLPPARDDRSLAGARPERHPLRGDDEARLPLRHELVALPRPEAHRPNHPGHPQAPRCVLSVKSVSGTCR